MIRVNLLGAVAKNRPRRPWIQPEQRGGAMGLAILLATALGVSGTWWNMDRARVAVEQEITTAEAELVRLKDVTRLVERATARKSELSERLALITRLHASERGPVDLLTAISDSLPDGLWLLELKQVGTMVQIEGRAISLTAVTDFVERLQTSGRFGAPIDIVTTSMETVAETSVVRFAVRGDARPGTGD